MKSLLVLFVSLFAVSAFACPDLNGTYQCEKDPQDANDSGVVTVSFENNMYVWTDKDDPSNPSMYPTDGVTYSDSGYTYKGTCTANTFDAVMTGTDAEYGAYTVNLSMKLDPQTNLLQVGHIKTANYGEGDFSSTCTRL